MPQHPQVASHELEITTFVHLDGCLWITQDGSAYAAPALATARRLHPALDADGVEIATGPDTAALLAPPWRDTG